MAKKKSPKKNTKSMPIVENALPQNILPIGERVEENKNIYISQPVYKEIHKFTQNKTTNRTSSMAIPPLFSLLCSVYQRRFRKMWMLCNIFITGM